MADAPRIGEITVLPRPEDDPELRKIADQIRQQYSKGASATMEAFEARLAIGHLLNRARELIVGDREFGDWVAGQHFGWSRQWNGKLMQAAKLEPYIRLALPQPELTEDEEGEPLRAPNFVKTLEAAKQRAIEAGDWIAPTPKVPLDPERGIVDQSAQEALMDFMDSAVLARFLAVEDAKWADITHQLQVTGTACFKQTTERMMQIHAIWKQLEARGRT